MPLKPIKPGVLTAYQKAQAVRIRKFLKSLATNDPLLISYINDRVVVLENEVKAKRLTTEDVALLLSDDYCRVSEVMSQGSAPQRWIIVWII